MSQEIVKEEKKLPQLIKMSDTYKLVVPSKVEEKIRYLIRKYPSTEWSGVLFYSHAGNFESNDLVLTCEDFLPMDLGSSGWTEFKMNEDVAAYIADNIELFGCEIGILHSHHSMGAFLSGQDMRRIQEDGNDTNCFLSLVVDTRGTYVAALTRKMQTKTEVVTKTLGTSYEFFGEGEVTTDKDLITEVTREVENNVIQYFMLDVEREEVTNPLSYLDERFNEIEKRKSQTNAPTYQNTHWYGHTAKEDEDFYTWLRSGKNEEKSGPKKPEAKEATLFTEEEMKELEVPVSMNHDPKAVHEAVVHMLTCSLILSAEKFDLKQWITKHMEKVYKRIFDDKETATGYPTLDNWIDFIVEFTLNTFDLPDETPYVDADEFYSSVAQALYNEISEYEGINPYVKRYLDRLESYIYY